MISFLICIFCTALFTHQQMKDESDRGEAWFAIIMVGLFIGGVLGAITSGIFSATTAEYKEEIEGYTDIPSKEILISIDPAYHHAWTRNTVDSDGDVFYSVHGKWAGGYKDISLPENKTIIKYDLDSGASPHIAYWQKVRVRNQWYNFTFPCDCDSTRTKYVIHLPKR